MKTFLSLLFCSVLSFAQAPAVQLAPVVPVVVPAPAPVTNCPNYMIGMGGGYIRNSGLPNSAEGWISGAVGLGGCNYLNTSIDLTSVNTIRFGYSKIFAVSGNLSAGGRIDSGIQATTPVIGSFSGGGFVQLDLQKFSKKLAGTRFTAELRVIGATGVASQATTTTSVSTSGQITTTTTSTGLPGASSQVNLGLYFGLVKTLWPNGN